MLHEILAVFWSKKNLIIGFYREVLEGSVLALVRGTFYEALAVHDFEKSNVELKYSTFSLFPLLCA